MVEYGRGGWRILSWLALLLPTLALAAPSYRLDYRIGFDPAAGEALVTMRVQPADGRLQRLRFRPDPERHFGFEGDGRISHEDGQLFWRPGRQGPSELRFRYRVDRIRGDASFDARITDDWTLLRGERLLPPVAALAPGGAVSEAMLEFDLPAGWSNAETIYPREIGTQRFVLDNPGRRFQQPLGWMLVGTLGVRDEVIDDLRVRVAAPRGSALRRNDVLAFINTTVAELRRVFGSLPPKILVVGADDPMWRGGLSGPRSLYLHADRPLISENGSSTLMHELVHVVGGIRGERGDDWIAEGLADYYGIEVMRRTGLLSDARAGKAIDWMRNRGRRIRSLHSDHSAGPRSARAVALFADLEAEIRRASDGERGLDDVVRGLAGRGRISRDELRAAVAEVIGAPSRVLATPLLKP